MKSNFKLEAAFLCCCCSVAKSCLILCDAMYCSVPGFAVLQYLPRFNQICVQSQWCYTENELLMQWERTKLYSASFNSFFPLVCPLKFSDKEMIISDRYVPMKLFTQGSIADHQLNGRAFEQTPGDSGGWGSLACCSSWGCRVGHNWATELKWIPYSATWMNLKIIMLNEVSNIETNIMCYHLYMES